MSVIIKNKNTLILDEKDVLIVKGISNGLTANSLAKKMKMNVRTVEGRVSRMLKQTKSKNSPQLVTFFIKNNLL